MRIALIGLVGIILAACGSSGPEPGSKEWCDATPLEKQIEDPTAMAKCLDAQ
jgi:hypothetical protein